MKKAIPRSREMISRPPLPGPFSHEMIREAEEFLAHEEEIMEKERAVRKDFRDIPTITIDPRDAKDFDDAISLRLLPGGIREVGIHIADVSFFVSSGSALDKEANKRSTSIYLVDRVIPMLPEELSNNLCSLVPGKERLAYSAVFEMKEDGSISKEWFGRSIIRSRARLTYEEAQMIMDGTAHEQAEMIQELTRITRKLRTQKFAQGAIAIHDTELRCEMDENGKPLSFYIVPHSESHQLIEDLMLLANRRVAEYASHTIKNKPGAFVYRIHDTPDMDKIAFLDLYARPMGYSILRGNKIDPAELNRLLIEVMGTPHQYFVHSTTLRAMAKAIYSTKNIGHFGLAFKHYTHFTSPIRRYPDLLVHRLLSEYLAGRTVKESTLKECDKAALHATEREVIAAEEERESLKAKQVEYLKEHIGMESNGTITGVTYFGIFVREETTGADGLIHVTRLPDDYYIFNEQQMTLIGERSKRVFRLGDTVRIKISHVDSERNQIDYELLS